MPPGVEAEIGESLARLEEAGLIRVTAQGSGPSGRVEFDFLDPVTGEVMPKDGPPPPVLTAEELERRIAERRRRS